MTVYHVTVSFGHRVLLKFYATEEYLHKFRKKVKKDEKFEMDFSPDVIIMINPDFIQAVVAQKTNDEKTLPIDSLEKTGIAFIELHN